MAPYEYRDSVKRKPGYSESIHRGEKDLPEELWVCTNSTAGYAADTYLCEKCYEREGGDKNQFTVCAVCSVLCH